MIDNNKIQQAADNYVGHEPETDESCYVTAKRDAFKDGAMWMQKEFVKFTWHDASEEPSAHAEIIILGKTESGYRSTTSNGKKMFHTYAFILKCGAWTSQKNYYNIVKWAYLDDILPKGGKE